MPYKTKEQQTARNKAYYASHKEENRERNKKYWQEHKTELTEKNRKYCEEHKEAITAQRRAYRQSHLLQEATHHREYYLFHKSEIAMQHKEYKATHRTETNLRSRRYYYAHRLSLMARQKEIDALIKKEVLTHYGNGKCACVKCGYADIRGLSIDHINGGGSKHRAIIGGGGDVFYRWLKRNNFPSGYQTYCGNCQLIKMDENKEHRNKFTVDR